MAGIGNNTAFHAKSSGLMGDLQTHAREVQPARTRAPRQSWAYPAETNARDLRIDFIRGLAILFVIVDHVHIVSLYYLVSHERIGVVSGAELFLALSGIVLGLVHRRRSIEDGWKSTAIRMWSRARLLYLTCFVVIFAAYLTAFLPLVDGRVLTTFTDEVTGTTYSLYGTTPLLTDYPVPAPAVLDIIFLNVGPYQFNIMGLYVVLLLIAPVAMRLLLAGKWWFVMSFSWAAYLADDVLNLRLIPSEFEYQFPLLSWQVLFFSGLAAGFYWKSIVTWFNRPLGRTVILLAMCVCVACIFFAWNNPALDADPYQLRFSAVPEETFRRVYEDLFRRDFLGPLRVANVAALIVVAYAVLTRFWAPLNKALGWLLIPLGGATLYVFILHLPFALIVSNIPILETGKLWINTIAHTIILLLLWIMVKKRMLFRWIPR